MPEAGKTAQYTLGRGYTVTWENTPAGLYLACGILNARDMLLAHHALKGEPITDYKRFRAVCAWVHTLPFPKEFTYVPAQLTEQWKDSPLPADGWLWRGITWKVDCYLLGGGCNVSMLQGFPSGEPFDAADIFAEIRTHLHSIPHATLEGEVA